MRHFKTPAGRVDSLRFSPDGRSVYLFSEMDLSPEYVALDHAYRLAVDSGEVTGDWAFKPSYIATFTPDLRSVYFAPASYPYSSSDPDSRYLHHLDLDSGSVQRVYDFDETDISNVTYCAISPDGRVLAINEYRRSDYAIRRLDLRTMTELEPIREDTVYLAYSRDGQWLATYGYNNRGVELWAETTCVHKWPVDGTALAWSHDGRLAWGADTQLTVARPGAEDASQSWNGTGERLTALAFSPDGRLLLVGNTTGDCTLHDSFVGEQLAAFDWGIGLIHSVAFAPDGLTCAAGGENGQVVIWDVDT